MNIDGTKNYTWQEFDDFDGIRWFTAFSGFLNVFSPSLEISSQEVKNYITSGIYTYSFFVVELWNRYIILKTVQFRGYSCFAVELKCTSGYEN